MTYVFTGVIVGAIVTIAFPEWTWSSWQYWVVTIPVGMLFGFVVEQLTKAKQTPTASQKTPGQPF
jgi:hypothetical protein